MKRTNGICCTVLAVLLAMSAVLWAQEQKGSASSRPAHEGRGGQVQRSAPAREQHGAPNAGARTGAAQRHPSSTDRGGHGSVQRGGGYPAGHPQPAAGSSATGRAGAYGNPRTGAPVRDRSARSGGSAGTGISTTPRAGSYAKPSTPGTVKGGHYGAGTPRTPNMGRPSAPGGSAGVSAAVRHQPSRTFRTVGGHHVGYDQRGHVRSIQTRSGAMIYRGPHRTVRVVRDLPGGRRVVYAGRYYGHVERAYVGGYRMRTYYEHGRYRAVVYRPYYWHGRPYYVYAPYYYYRPAYYGWVYNPWPRPIVYRWIWFDAPWYRTYGYYFAPAPVYPAASYWLADFILAEYLRMTYEARWSAALTGEVALAGTTPSAEAQLTPEVKQLIAEEVKQQLAAEKNAAGQAGQAEATSPEAMPPALDPAHSVFVVSGNLDVVTETGGECALTPGDIITRIADAPDGDGKVQVRVAASKRGDCAVGSKPSLALEDLEEMHNQFRERMDAGLKQLADNSGKNGLPSAPDTSTVLAKDVPAPEPDKDVASELQGLQDEAEQAEQEVKKESATGPGGTL